MAHVIRPTYSRIDPRTGKRIRKRLKKWYAVWREPSGRLRRTPGYTDKEATKALALRLESHAARVAEGLADRFEEHRRRPLKDHLGDYARFLGAKGASAKHARQTCSRIDIAFLGCRFTFMGDVSPSSLLDWLKAEREAERIGVRTSNYYLRDCKSFCTWLMRDGRTDRNPLAHVSGLNANVDDSRERRALSPDEFTRLVDAARHGAVRRKLAGPDRAPLYIAAAYSGFRVGELASLCPESFDLAAGQPTVTVEAAYSKRRRTDIQPLPSVVVQELQAWLEDKPPGELLWPGGWVNHAAKLVRADLQAARSAWLAEALLPRQRQEREETDFLVYEDSAGRVVDFHALRHTYISNLAAAGVHPKVAQTLARHSTITLTMDRYAHVALFDQAAALEKLPDFRRDDESEGTATGTDGR